MKSGKKIAFFDSGVGGLTVLDKFKKLMPHEDCIYFGDLKNSPYGAKSKGDLIKIAHSVFKFLETKSVKAVVMACNTTSANTYEELKDNYNFKIYPIIQSCAKSLAAIKMNKVGVLATEATINSAAYSRELRKYNPNLEVFEISCPKWVRIVEQKAQDKIENVTIIKENLEIMLKNKPDKIILGCTHYPFLLNVLSNFAEASLFIDPAIYFAEFVKQDLKENNLLNKKNDNGSDEFYVTANPAEFKNASDMFYPLKELPMVVDI